MDEDSPIETTQGGTEPAVSAAPERESPSATSAEEAPAAPPPGGRASVKVEDRRFWARGHEAEEETGTGEEVPPSPYPTLVEELRRRAEAAERTLREYVEAYKQAQVEHEQARERLLRDVERRAEERFGQLVAELLDGLDDLDLALKHAAGTPGAEPLAEGVALARDRLLAALRRQGIERLAVEGADFDPHVAEAVAVEPVDDPSRVGRVLRVERPGYRLGGRVIRAARVVVGQRPS